MNLLLQIARFSYWMNKRAMRSKNPENRRFAAVSLGHLHEVARLPTPQMEALLIPALQDEDSRVRAQAALSLSWNGYSKNAIPFLQAALDDPDGKVRKSAIYALQRQDTLLPQIASMIDDSDNRVREEVVRIIGNFPKDKNYIPLLVKATKDETVNVRREAVFTLGEIGIRENIPTLEWIRDNDFSLAWQGVKGKEDSDVTISFIANMAIKKIKERQSNADK